MCRASWEGLAEPCSNPSRAWRSSASVYVVALSVTGVADNMVVDILFAATADVEETDCGGGIKIKAVDCIN